MLVPSSTKAAVRTVFDCCSKTSISQPYLASRFALSCARGYATDSLGSRPRSSPQPPNTGASSGTNANALPRPPPSKQPDVEAFSGPSQPRQYYERPTPRELPHAGVRFPAFLHLSWLQLILASTEKMAYNSRRCHSWCSRLGRVPHLCDESREDIKLCVQVHRPRRKARFECGRGTWRGDQTAAGVVVKWGSVCKREGKQCLALFKRMHICLQLGGNFKIGQLQGNIDVSFRIKGSKGTRYSVPFNRSWLTWMLV